MTDDVTPSVDVQGTAARTTADPDAGDGYGQFLAGQEAMLAWMSDPDNDNHADMAEIRAALHREPVEDVEDVEALAMVLYEADSGAVVLDMDESQEMAEAVIASGWLDDVRRKAGDDRAEQIAQAIEVLEPKPWYVRTARIARETR